MYAPHPNGGGLVEDTAHVDATAYVGPNAHVRGSAQVYGRAQVCGNARVYGDSFVGGDAHVFGNARVCGNAHVSWNATVFSGAVSVTPTRLSLIGSPDVQITDEYLTIGCQTHTFAHWRKYASEIAEKHGARHLLKYRDLIERLITEHLVAVKGRVV